MDFVWKLYGNTYAVHVTVALVGVATLNLALPPPPLILREGYLAAIGERPATTAVTGVGCSAINVDVVSTPFIPAYSYSRRLSQFGKYGRSWDKTLVLVA